MRFGLVALTRIPKETGNGYPKAVVFQRSKIGFQENLVTVEKMRTVYQCGHMIMKRMNGMICTVHLQ